jgi:hypothetical protein
MIQVIGRPVQTELEVVDLEIHPPLISDENTQSARQECEKEEKNNEI